MILVPAPEVTIPPGSRVNVQLPDEGSPFRTTLPVAKSQVGWVIVPTVGGAGTGGGWFITIFEENADVQPEALVTLNLYVPGEKE